MNKKAALILRKYPRPHYMLKIIPPDQGMQCTICLGRTDFKYVMCNIFLKLRQYCSGNEVTAEIFFSIILFRFSEYYYHVHLRVSIKQCCYRSYSSRNNMEFCILFYPFPPQILTVTLAYVYCIHIPYSALRISKVSSEKLIINFSIIFSLIIFCQIFVSRILFNDFPIQWGGAPICQ